MPRYFWIGGLPDGVQPTKHLRRTEEMLTVADGEIIEAWGHVGQWDDKCPRPDELERWRLEGDPLCDAALLELFPQPSSSVGKDLLHELQRGASENPTGTARAFLDAVMERPPSDIRATEEEISLGTDFYYEHSLQIMQALMFFSLAGGFASPAITKTLYKVSYLVPRNPTASPSEIPNDRTFSRLLETFQYVLDVMGCEPPASRANEKDAPVLSPGGSGWASTVRVRMLHGVVRRRIRERDTRVGVQDDDIPINQEDLAATLASFSIAPLWCIRRVGLPLNHRHAAAYIALWREVGFYMGVSEGILRKYFCDQMCGERFLALAGLHLFSPPPGMSADAPPEYTPPTMHILAAIANRPPFPASFPHNCALARFFLGDVLADHLTVPQTPFIDSLRLKAALAIQAAPVQFGRAYAFVRPGWRRKRVRVMKGGMERTVRWLLGLRRTSYRPRTAPSSIPDTSALSDGQPETEGGDIGEGVLDVEKLVPDPEGAKRLQREYKEVFMEMGVVCVAISLVAVLSAYQALSWVFR